MSDKKEVSKHEGEYIALFEELMGESYGIISVACLKVGVNRRTLLNHTKDCPILKDELNKSVRIGKANRTKGLVTKAIKGLERLIEEGNATAIIFALKTQGKKYGFVEPQHIKEAEQAKSEVTVEINLDPKKL